MRGLAAAFAAIVLAGCGASPTTPGPGSSPAPASSSFEGTWQIEYRISDCAGLRHCVLFINTTRTLTLRVLQRGAGFEGVVSVSEDNVDVSGSQTGRELTLHGIRRPAIAGDYEVEVTKLDLRREGAGITGAFDYTVRGPSNSSFFGNSRVGGPIIKAERLGSAAVTEFTGAWRGRVAVRDCSSIGWPDCYPHAPRDTHPIELALTQQGTAVTGTLQWSGTVPVQGTVSGSSVTIQGTATEPNFAFDEITTLRPSTLARDHLGRLSGTIGVEIKWPPKLPDIWTYKVTDYRVVELISVAMKNP